MRIYVAIIIALLGAYFYLKRHAARKRKQLDTRFGKKRFGLDEDEETS